MTKKTEQLLRKLIHEELLMEGTSKFKFKGGKPIGNILSRAAGSRSGRNGYIGKSMVIQIVEPNSLYGTHKYTILLAVQSGDDNWKWITLKAKFDTSEEAEEFCHKNYSQIVDKFDLYMGITY